MQSNLNQVVAREYLTSEARENSTHVTVYLEDTNDNWPEFEQELYNASLRENSPKDTYVTTITVSIGTSLSAFIRYLYVIQPPLTRTLLSESLI